jgi:hypothetical protein
MGHNYFIIFANKSKLFDCRHNIGKTFGPEIAIVQYTNKYMTTINRSQPAADDAVAISGGRTRRWSRRGGRKLKAEFSASRQTPRHHVQRRMSPKVERGVHDIVSAADEAKCGVNWPWK